MGGDAVPEVALPQLPTRSDRRRDRRTGPSRPAEGLPRSLNLAMIGLLVWAALRDQPGRTTWDTKLDLWVDPARFLSRSLHLWNPDWNFGELQNQAYGYLFPQGPFALAGQLIGVPGWITQRLWTLVVLLAAYLGARACARAILPTDVAGRTGAVLAGAAFVAAPRLAGLGGVLTSEALPSAMLPWALLPLIAHRQGRMRARSAGLLCGLAVLLMGGINAVAVVALLPAVVVMLCAQPRGRRAGLVGWTGAALVAATAWWAIPLVLLGRYSPPFLDFVETSRATTFPLGWFNVLRGATHWVAFTEVGDSPWWPGAFALHAGLAGVVLSAASAGLGLVGLVHPRMPLRGPLRTMAVVGGLLLVAGHSGWFGSPVAPVVQWLLDGPLSMLRNVHKVDAVLRLPMAIGVGWAATVLLRERRRSSVRSPALLTAMALALAGPLAIAPDRMPGWSDIPASWSSAAEWLAEHTPPGTRSLVLPAASFGDQSWGRTIDEPMQAVARTPWVSRSQVPLTPPQTIRLLDVLTSRVEDVGGAEHLAVVLRRLGISSVVVRSDLTRSVVETRTTSAIAQALSRVPGLRQAARFEDAAGGSVVIHRLDDPAPSVRSVPLTSTSTVSGGVEDVVAAIEAGLLAEDGATVVGSDAAALPPGSTAPVVAGDGQVRRERAFGRVRDAVGAARTAADPWRDPRRVHDYPGVDDESGEVTAHYTGIEGLTASSSADDPGVLGPLRGDQAPHMAVDGDLLTGWRSDPLTDPTDQWLEFALDGQPVEDVLVVTGVNPFESTAVRELTITTDDGQRVPVRVNPSDGSARARLRGTPVHRLRIATTVVEGRSRYGAVMVQEIGIGGVVAGRGLSVPTAVPADAGVVLRTAPPTRACLSTPAGPRCDLAAERGPEESKGLVRRLTVTSAGEFTVTGAARAASSRATTDLLDPLGGAASVRASTTFADDPAVAPRRATDGDPVSAWVAAPGDPDPTLTLEFPGTRLVSGIRIIPSSAGPAPVSADIDLDGTRRRVDLAGGAASFTPVAARRAVVRLQSPSGEGRPVAVAELELSGVADLSSPTAGPTGAICGLGPELVIDGLVRRTRVEGSIADVLRGGDLEVSVCDGRVYLGEGTHEIAWRPTSTFLVREAVLRPSASARPASAARAVTVLDWSSNRRRLRIDAGAASLVAVAENVNPGWVATMGGRPLTSLRIDGWQQGYLVPAGAGGTIDLEFAPDRPYRAGLLVGALAALMLAAAALWSARGQVPAGPAATGAVDDAARPWARVLALGMIGLLGGLGVVGGMLLALLPGVRRRPARVVAAGVSAACLLSVIHLLTGGGAMGMPALVDALAGLTVGYIALAVTRPTARAR